MKFKAACLALLMGTSAVAMAKGAKVTHHCKLADGSVDAAAKNKKLCTTAKGTWEKADAAAKPADAAPAPTEAAPATPAPAETAPAPTK